MNLYTVNYTIVDGEHNYAHREYVVSKSKQDATHWAWSQLDNWFGEDNTTYDVDDDAFYNASGTLAIKLEYVTQAEEFIVPTDDGLWNYHVNYVVRPHSQRK